MEFPIVRIRDGRYQAWRTELGGARALAINGARALLYGSYEHRDAFRVVELGDNGVATMVQEGFVVDEHGKRIGNTLVYGVGEKLYLFANRAVCVVTSWA
jgi:hypothetical protein